MEKIIFYSKHLLTARSEKLPNTSFRFPNHTRSHKKLQIHPQMMHLKNEKVQKSVI